MFERFTDRGRRVVVLSQEEARELNHNYIGTEHILLALMLEGEGIAARVLEHYGLTADRIRAAIEAEVGLGDHSPAGHIAFTPIAKKLFKQARLEGLQLGHNYIGPEHLLLALIHRPESVGYKVLFDRLQQDSRDFLRTTIRFISPQDQESDSERPDPLAEELEGTDDARRIVVVAQAEARMLSCNYIGTEHLLLACIKVLEGVASQALTSLGLDYDQVQRKTKEALGEGSHCVSGHIPFTPAAKKVLELALREAFNLGVNYISTEHILLAMLRPRDEATVAADILLRLGLVPRDVRARVVAIVQGKYPEPLEGTSLTRDYIMAQIGDMLVTGNVVIAAQYRLLVPGLVNDEALKWVDSIAEKLGAPAITISRCIQFAVNLTQVCDLLTASGALEREHPKLPVAAAAFVEECLRERRRRLGLALKSGQSTRV